MKNLQKNSLKLNLLVTIFCFFSMSSTSFSQNSTPNSNFWEHVSFGGGLGLSFGDGFFSGTIAPSAIYQFNDDIAIGIGLNGTYNKQEDFYKSTILGGSLIGLYNPINELQLSTEFEQLNVDRKWERNIGTRNENYWYPALFLGAGYRSGNVTVGFRYDVLYDQQKSIYADPWMPFIRVYF